MFNVRKTLPSANVSRMKSIEYRSSALRLVDIKPAVLSLPTMIGLLRDGVRAASINDSLPGLDALEDVDDLLFSESAGEFLSRCDRPYREGEGGASCPCGDVAFTRNQNCATSPQGHRQIDSSTLPSSTDVFSRGRSPLFHSAAVCDTRYLMGPPSDLSLRAMGRGMQTNSVRISLPVSRTYA